MSFTQQEFEDLTALLLTHEAGEIAQWCASHLEGPRDLYQLLVTVAMMIQETWPLAVTEGHTASESGYFILDTSEAGPGDECNIVLMQTITAALNGDRADVLGHLLAAVERDDDGEFGAMLLARMLAAYAFGLQAIVEKNRAAG